MPRIERTLVFEDEALAVSVEFILSTADYGRSILRTTLHETNVRVAAAAITAAAASGNTAELSVAQRDATLSAYLYPAMIAAVSKVIRYDGLCATWPPTIEEFTHMPELLGIEWEALTFITNPHWLPKVEAPKEAKQAEDPKNSNGSHGS